MQFDAFLICPACVRCVLCLRIAFAAMKIEGSRVPFSRNADQTALTFNSYHGRTQFHLCRNNPPFFCHDLFRDAKLRKS